MSLYFEGSQYIVKPYFGVSDPRLDYQVAPASMRQLTLTVTSKTDGKCRAIQFEPGLSNNQPIYSIQETMNGQPLIVILASRGYVLQFEPEFTVHEISADPILHTITSEDGVIAAFADCTDVELIDLSTFRSTRIQVASDGIRNLTTDGDVLKGEGWIAHLESWVPFGIHMDSMQLSFGEKFD